MWGRIGRLICSGSCVAESELEASRPFLHVRRIVQIGRVVCCGIFVAESELQRAGPSCTCGEPCGSAGACAAGLALLS
eukprot:352736-Chlamydomonas_euryale.AAC.2